MKAKDEDVIGWLKRQLWVQKSLLRQDEDAVCRIEGSISMINSLIGDIERTKPQITKRVRK